MQLSSPSLKLISGNITIELSYGGCLHPTVMFSIETFQLGRGLSCSDFLKILWNRAMIYPWQVLIKTTEAC